MVPWHTHLKNTDLYQDSTPEGTKLSIRGGKSPEEAVGKIIWKKNPVLPINYAALIIQTSGPPLFHL